MPNKEKVMYAPKLMRLIPARAGDKKCCVERYGRALKILCTNIMRRDIWALQIRRTEEPLE